MTEPVAAFRSSAAADKVERGSDMDIYFSLLGIAKLLLADDVEGKAPEVLLRRVLEATEAERGFIVVREGDTYEQKFDVHFERAEISSAERRFSRSLVRMAIETRRPVHTANPLEDPRFSSLKSLQAIGAGAVLVTPLVHENDVYGAIYLQRSGSGRDFSGDARHFVAEFAELAGMFLRRTMEREALRRRNRSLERDLFAQHDFEGIVTQHPAMLELLRMVAQVADSGTTVLIRGETGTGKELIARALHLNSGRKDSAFITLHTTALPGTILESELFGHVKGAFTGADRERAGRIASAHGGTLFLDEVAEIAPEAQAKLLRFLQFGEIQRVGSDRTQKVDVRILAATHQDLPALVQSGRFRQDLYFRLKVIELQIPPLRARATDIPLLIEHSLRAHWKRPGERPRWTAEAERALSAYPYPGNVRELAHVIERACALATSPELGLDLLPPELAPAGPPEPAAGRRFTQWTAEELEAARENAVVGVEREFLEGLMNHCGGNVSQASRTSGIHRSQLQKLLARNRGD